MLSLNLILKQYVIIYMYLYNYYRYYVNWITICLSAISIISASSPIWRHNIMYLYYSFNKNNSIVPLFFLRIKNKCINWPFYAMFGYRSTDVKKLVMSLWRSSIDVPNYQKDYEEVSEKRSWRVLIITIFSKFVWKLSDQYGWWVRGACAHARPRALPPDLALQTRNWTPPLAHQSDHETIFYDVKHETYQMYHFYISYRHPTLYRKTKSLYT